MRMPHMVETTLTSTITAVLGRAPSWIRQDLLAKEYAIRVRAEEALAAMIADAIARASNDGVQDEPGLPI